MTKMLELSNSEFKTTMINILKALMEKMDDMPDHIGNISREKKTLKKSNDKARSEKYSNR